MTNPAEIYPVHFPLVEAHQTGKPAFRYYFSLYPPTPPVPPTPPTPPIPPIPPTLPATSLQLAIARLPQYLRL